MGHALDLVNFRFFLNSLKENSLFMSFCLLYLNLLFLTIILKFISTWDSRFKNAKTDLKTLYPLLLSLYF